MQEIKRYRNGQIRMTIFLSSIILLYCLPAELIGRPFGSFSNFVILVQLFILFTLLVSQIGQLKLTKNYYIPLVFPVFLLLLTLVSLALSGGELILSDTFELAKPLLMILAVTAPCALTWKAEDLKKFIFLPLMLVVLVSFLVYLIEILGGSLGREFSLLYKRDMGVLAYKAVGSFSTTYIAGTFFSFVSILFLNNSLLIKSERFKVRFLYFSIFVFSFLLVVGSQSRTSFLALFIAVFFNFLILSFYSGKIRKHFLLGVFSLLLLVVSFAPVLIELAKTNYPYLYSGIVNYVINFEDSLSTKNSLTVRLSQVSLAIEKNNLILIGKGIDKSEMRMLESWYALYYYRYGLAGMIAYTFFWALVVFSGFKASRKSYSNEVRSFAIAMISFSVLLPVFGMSSVATDFPLMLGFYYLMAGLLFNFSINKRSTVSLV